MINHNYNIQYLSGLRILNFILQNNVNYFLYMFIIAVIIYHVWKHTQKKQINSPCLWKAWFKSSAWYGLSWPDSILFSGVDVFVLFLSGMNVLNIRYRVLYKQFQLHNNIIAFDTYKLM